LCSSQAILYRVTETLARFAFHAVARSQDLAPCRTCGRCFAQDVLLRHDPVCRKVFNKKHKPFSSMKQRLQGTEIMTIKKQHPQKLWKETEVHRGLKQEEESVKQRRREGVLNCILSAPVKQGNPSPVAYKLTQVVPFLWPDYIQCPHCSQRFNEAAAERHIKFCEEQAICHAFAAKTTRPVGKQLVTQRKPPAAAALPLQKV
ncbi:zinc finger C2HC domain-containing protein 1B, partial [Pezoporus flaviventris]|uniref:zinc finger C2HC domain-containing protein 1B n=1 Tax=Pezoporus flaviventris TaxID=889875 RepID=UPI002AAF25FF